MSKSNGLTRGDRNRNGRLDRLRALVPSGHAIVGVDLGDKVQMVVVTDRDSRVLARRKFAGKAHQLGGVLEWAAAQAAEGGFAGVTVGCEPTGSRWLQVQQLVAERGLLFVCVQPMATARAREADDYTRDKTDYRDAVLIARLVGQLSCYVPELADESWALLRHQGARRAKLITSRTASVQLVRSMLELAWPAVLDAAADPFDSMNWKAAIAVVLDRSDGRPEKVRSTMSRARFTAAVRRELPRWGGQQIRRRIINAVYDVLTSTDGAVPAQRRAALQRAGWAIDDLRAIRPNLERIETEMVEVLGELGLAELVSTIAGLTPTTAAAILAETGDPARFDSARSMVKHAGINPAENTSGQHTGRTRITKRGRPRLRLAAWRAAWAIVRYNPVAAARYQHLTTRDKDRLTDHQAIIAIAAATLRWIHAITTTGQAWDPAIATGDRPHNQPNQKPIPIAA